MGEIEWKEAEGSQADSKPTKANFIRSYGLRIILFGYMLCFPTPHGGDSALFDHGYSLASEVLSKGTMSYWHWRGEPTSWKQGGDTLAPPRSVSSVSVVAMATLVKFRIIHLFVVCNQTALAIVLSKRTLKLQKLSLISSCPFLFNANWQCYNPTSNPGFSWDGWLKQ